MQQELGNALRRAWLAQRAVRRPLGHTVGQVPHLLPLHDTDPDAFHVHSLPPGVPQDLAAALRRLPVTPRHARFGPPAATGAATASRTRGGVHRLRSTARAGLLLCVLTATATHRCDAQTPEDASRRLNEAQAAAASRTLVLAVQQAVSSLPPSSGQAFTYAFDTETGVLTRGDRLGPTVLHGTETTGRGQATLRIAGSYLGLGQTFGPITESVTIGRQAPLFTAIGTTLDAKVGVMSLSLTYGVLDKLDAYLTLPIVATDVTGSQLASIDRITGGNAFDTRRALERALATGRATMESFDLLGFDDGTRAGVGRINVGTRGLLFATSAYRLAGSCDFYFPSPNERRFAGSASASILPRLMGSAKLADWLRLYADAGYDYDLDIRQLRRFTWDAGLSVPLAALTADVGFGGSHYATPIRWIPDRLTLPGGSSIVATALGPNETGTNLVSFLAGLKVRVGARLVLSGAVGVPVTDPGVQPTATGTIAAELYFRD